VDKQQTNANITKEVFYEHFVELNQNLSDTNNETISNIDFDTLPYNNVELNQPFSADKVKMAVNNLKICKCPIS